MRCWRSAWRGILAYKWLFHKERDFWAIQAQQGVLGALVDTDMA